MVPVQTYTLHINGLYVFYFISLTFSRPTYRPICKTTPLAFYFYLFLFLLWNHIFLNHKSRLIGIAFKIALVVFCSSWWPGDISLGVKL